MSTFDQTFIQAYARELMAQAIRPESEPGSVHVVRPTALSAASPSEVDPPATADAVQQLFNEVAWYQSDQDQRGQHQSDQHSGSETSHEQTISATYESQDLGDDGDAAAKVEAARTFKQQVVQELTRRLMTNIGSLPAPPAASTGGEPTLEAETEPRSQPGSKPGSLPSPSDGSRQPNEKQPMQTCEIEVVDPPAGGVDYRTDVFTVNAIASVNTWAIELASGLGSFVAPSNFDAFPQSKPDEQDSDETLPTQSGAAEHEPTESHGTKVAETSQFANVADQASFRLDSAQTSLAPHAPANPETKRPQQQTTQPVGTATPTSEVKSPAELGQEYRLAPMAPVADEPATPPAEADTPPEPSNTELSITLPSPETPQAGETTSQLVETSPEDATVEETAAEEPASEAAAQPTSENCMIPVWEVDSFHWPAVADSIADSMTEPFRRAVAEMIDDSDCKTIAVSSPCRGAGRTQTAVALARSFNRAGQRVLLVDLDTENPDLATQLNLNAPCCWAEATVESMPLAEAAIASVSDGVTVVPLAAIDGEPAPKTTQAFLKRLADVEQQYDLIILDVGPIDSMIKQVGAVSSVVGASLVICDLRTDTDADMDSAVARLKSSGFEQLCVIDNFTD